MAKQKKRVPDYLQAIADNPPYPSSVVVVHVYHDEDCAFWRGGVCDCKPDIVYEYIPIKRGGHERQARQ